MLRGHKEMVDNRVSTLVTSADSKAEYDEFINVAIAQSKKDRNFNEVFTSEPLQHWTEDRFRPFKVPVHCFHHDDEAQRDAFFVEWKIKELDNAQQSADQQSNMVDEVITEQEDTDWEARKAARAEAIAKGETPERDATIGEALGLDIDDPWDRRTDEEKETDRQMREYADKARKAGTMTTDSFSPDPRRDPNAADGNIHVVDADGFINPDGTLDVNSIMAAKWTPGNKNPNVVPGAQGPVGTPSVPMQGTGNTADEAIDDLIDQMQDTMGIPTTPTTPATPAAPDDFDLDDFDAILNASSSNSTPTPPSQPKPQGNSFFNPPGGGGGAPAQAPAATTSNPVQDFKDKQDQNDGVFKGSDLFGDDEVEVASLPQAVQKALANNGFTDTTIVVKDYPFNSQLAGRSIIPFAGWGTVKLDPTNLNQVTTIAATVNLTIEGTMNMGEVAAAIVSRSNVGEDGFAIYQRSGGKLGTAVTTSVVRIRG